MDIKYRYTFPIYKPTYVQILYSKDNIKDDEIRRDNNRKAKETQMVVPLVHTKKG